jgi:uncharacterized protein (TIGR00730 family)
MLINAVCVFCGANPGADPRLADVACELGRELAETGRTLVYGGAKVGLMGALADSALAAGGRVIGVIPQALVDKEVAHRGLSELHVVSSMHERKQMMSNLANAFIALPGGLGTLEELFEVWTWAQLGLHQKPLGLLGPKGFFDALLLYLDQLVNQKLVRAEHRQMIALHEAPKPLLAGFEAYEPTALPKWIGRSDT